MEMLVLALDTTTRTGGAALVEDGVLIEARDGDGSIPHAARLPAALLDLLAAHGRALTDVHLLAVAAGPGSFTGLRIGIATMQGLAFATGCPLIGVSALEALAIAAALELGGGRHAVAVWQDAQRGEVFSAAYDVRVDPEGAAVVTEVDPPVAAPPDGVLGRWRRESRLAGMAAAGDGILRYHDLAAGDSSGLFANVITSHLAIAPAVARLAAQRLAAGGSFPPHALQPFYVRRPDAELARERRRHQP